MKESLIQTVTIYVRFNVPPLFIVPPPREWEHVPLSRLQDGGNSRNTEVRTEVRPNATLSKGLYTERRAPAPATTALWPPSWRRLSGGQQRPAVRWAVMLMGSGSVGVLNTFVSVGRVCEDATRATSQRECDFICTSTVIGHSAALAV